METGQRIQAKARRDDEEMIKWDSFVPRSESKVIFVLVMVCYTWTITALLNGILNAFHFKLTPPPFLAPPNMPFLCVLELLVAAPLVESITMIGVIELFRLFRAPPWLQIFAAALAMGFLHSVSLDTAHSVSWSMRGVLIAPGFAIQGAAYVYWCRVSRAIAFGIVMSIHALHNVIPAIPLIGYGFRQMS